MGCPRPPRVPPGHCRGRVVPHRPSQDPQSPPDRPEALCGALRPTRLRSGFSADRPAWQGLSIELPVHPRGRPGGERRGSTPFEKL